MTRDEHRAKCIEEMAIAWLRKRGYKSPNDIPNWLMRLTIEEQTAAFDSLRLAGARVVSIVVTWEMLRATSLYKWSSEQIAQMNAFHGLDKDFTAMSAAGDLTNPPETKP